MADTGNTVVLGPVVNPPSRLLQETVTQSGKTPLGSAFPVSVDGISILGSGGAQDPLRTAGSVAGNRQTFQYVATGAENPAGFPIAFPAARASTNYTADVTTGIAGNAYAFNLTAKAVGSITVAGGPLTAGDVLQITVQDLT